MHKISIALCLVGFTTLAVIAVGAQKRKVEFRVCGDPTAACKQRENFQPFQLPFEYTSNFHISESQLFYAVILKSVKESADPDQRNCDKAITEEDHINTQKLFPHNAVFVMRCWEPGEISYTNVADGVSFIGVYAGQTLADANAILAKVKATGKFVDATIRRMRVQMNGT
jgi:hypothetical protein